MSLHRRYLVLGVLLGNANVLHAQQDPGQVCIGRISSIPPPDDKQIATIHDAKDWTNAYVMVSGDGYELILHGEPRTSKRLSLAELRRRLINLPSRAWPLGRVVAVQQNALSRASERQAVMSRLADLRALLGSLCIRTDPWPSS